MLTWRIQRLAHNRQAEMRRHPGLLVLSALALAHIRQITSMAALLHLALGAAEVVLAQCPALVLETCHTPLRLDGFLLVPACLQVHLLAQGRGVINPSPLVLEGHLSVMQLSLLARRRIPSPRLDPAQTGRNLLHHLAKLPLRKSLRPLPK
jgi:hypothetical protein